MFFYLLYYYYFKYICIYIHKSLSIPCGSGKVSTIFVAVVCTSVFLMVTLTLFDALIFVKIFLKDGVKKKFYILKGIIIPVLMN